MNHRKGLIIAGTTTFLIFLVGGMPASAVLGSLGPAGARFTGVTGTVWSGSVTAAEFGGLRLGETQWSLSPLPLLLARVSGDLTTRIGDGNAVGAVEVSMSGVLSCVDCFYEGPVAGLWPLIPALKLLDGRVRIDLASLEVRDKWPTRLIGVVKISNMPLGLPGAPLTPGAPTASFEATVNADPVSDDGVVEATIQDSGGPVQMTARLTVTKPGNYEFSGRAKARPDASPDMVNALKVLGPKGSDGSTELAMSGSF